VPAGVKNRPISIVGFNDATWEANLVDLSDLRWFRTLPLMVEVGGDWNTVSGPWPVGG